MSGGAPQPTDDATRKYRLSQAIQNEVVAGGRVESQSDFGAVMRFGNPPNHVLHLIVSLVTCLFWTPVWMALAVIYHLQKKTVTLTVNEYGQVLKTYRVPASTATGQRGLVRRCVDRCVASSTHPRPVTPRLTLAGAVTWHPADQHLARAETVADGAVVGGRLYD